MAYLWQGEVEYDGKSHLVTLLDNMIFYDDHQLAITGKNADIAHKACWAILGKIGSL